METGIYRRMQALCSLLKSNISQYKAIRNSSSYDLAKLDMPAETDSFEEIYLLMSCDNF